MAESQKDYAKWKKPDAEDFIRFRLYEMSRKDKIIETESRLVVAWGWGRGRNWLQIGLYKCADVIKMFYN